MKVIAVNASPRKGWNTDLLVNEAAKGAKAAGAEVEIIDLYKLEPFTGCISCFGCKEKTSEGKCVYRDGLTDVLEKIRQADGLILGSPIYLSNLTAGFLSLYERLVFQSITYNKERPSYNKHMIPVLLITTSNVGIEMFDEFGYHKILEGYRRTLGNYVGPTQILACGNTLQVNDYSKYNWTIFDPEAKKKRRMEQFPMELKRAFDLGKGMLQN